MAPCRDAKSACRCPTPPQRQWFRRRLLDLVPPARPRSAVARDARSVSHPRVRSHAAADAGRSRAAEVPRVARAYPSFEALAAAPEARGRARPGIRSATTSARGGCRRSRAKRWRTLRRRAARRRGDAAVVQGHRRVHGRRGAELRVRQARGDSRHQRRARAVPRLRRPRRPESARDEAAPLGRLARRAAPPARLRLQPGADGLRRDGLHARASPQCLHLPDAPKCRAYPVQPATTCTR